MSTGGGLWEYRGVKPTQRRSPTGWPRIAIRSNARTLSICANKILLTPTANKEGYESGARKPRRMASPKSATGAWRWVLPPGKLGSCWRGCMTTLAPYAGAGSRRLALRATTLWPWATAGLPLWKICNRCANTAINRKAINMPTIRRKHQWKIGRNLLDFPRFSRLLESTPASEKSEGPAIGRKVHSRRCLA